MKRNGKTFTQKISKTIKLPRPDGVEDIEFTVNPLPLGYQEEMDSALPLPSPPNKLVKTGVKPVRDNMGKLQYEPNYDDPTFIYDLNETSRCRMVYQVFNGLKEQVEWTFAKREDGMSIKNHCLQVFKEIEEANFSPGDMAILCTEIQSISNMTSEALEEARSDL